MIKNNNIKNNILIFFYSRTLIVQKLRLLKLLSRKVQNEDKIF